MAITHSIDTRYDNDANIVTHDKIKHKCINADILMPLNNRIQEWIRTELLCT